MLKSLGLKQIQRYFCITEQILLILKISKFITLWLEARGVIEFILRQIILVKARAIVGHLMRRENIGWVACVWKDWLSFSSKAKYWSRRNKYWENLPHKKLSGLLSLAMISGTREVMELSIVHIIPWRRIWLVMVTA